jgi:hypothetical protein
MGEHDAQRKRLTWTHGALGIPLPIRVVDDYDPAWLAREYALHEGYAQRQRDAEGGEGGEE